VQDFFTQQTLFFALAIFVFSFLLRRTLEVLAPTLSTATPVTFAQRVWEELFLPSLPILLGMLLGLCMKSWDYPKTIDTLLDRVAYGAVCGFFSSWAYRLARAVFTQKFNVDVDAPVPSPGLPGDKPKAP